MSNGNGRWVILFAAVVAASSCTALLGIDGPWELYGSGGAGGGATAASSMTNGSGDAGAAAGDGSGDGGACQDPTTDCPSTANECIMAVCSNARCDTKSVPPGTTITDQTVGDCKKRICDNNGVAVEATDDSDKPNDMNDCTTDT